MCTEPHVCVNGVDTTAPELDLSSKSCQSNVYSIYLDGGNQNNQGYSGAIIHGNVMTAAWGGAVFVNGGGNVNVSNNVILDGRLWQLSMPCYPGSTNKTPGSSFDGNIISFDGSLPRKSGFGTVLYSNCIDGWGAPQTTDPQRFVSMDHNLYWSPTVDVRAAPHLFPSLSRNATTTGDVPSSWDEWRAQRRTPLPTDQHSAVGDPLFRDPARGDYRLQEGSPAWGLGWKALPWPTQVPRERM